MNSCAGRDEDRGRLVEVEDKDREFTINKERIIKKFSRWNEKCIKKGLRQLWRIYVTNDIKYNNDKKKK